MLELGSYKTAWAWLHKLRRAMAPPDTDKLSGVTEVDVTHIGWGRGRYATALVAVAVEMKAGPDRVRIRHISGLQAATLERFVADVVECRALVRTSERIGSLDLQRLGYRRHVTMPARSRDDTLESVASGFWRLNQWLANTFWSAVSDEHLDYYLDEYTFRHNNRTANSPGLLFYRLLERAVRTHHTPLQDIILATGRGRRT